MEIVVFDGKGGVRRVERLEGPPSSGFVWLDFARDGSAGWAAEVRRITGVSIHDNHIADALNLGHPSYFEGTRDYEMLVFRSLAPEAGGERFETRPTAFFLGERWLATVREPDSRSVAAVKDRLGTRAGRAPQEPAALMHQVLNAMVDRFLTMREVLSGRLDRWQGELLNPDRPFTDWRELMALDAELRRLEVLCEGQEDAVETWRGETGLELGEGLSVRYNDLLEHVRRVLGHARHLQGQIQSLVQVHFAALAHRTNEIVRVLTVMAAVFLPLTFVAGVYGMNFEHMPELGYQYGYFVVLGAMGVLAVGLVGLFRWRRWI